MTLVAGTKLGRYEIRSRLGEGGMGEVYRAFDTKLNRDVAIKVLPAEYSQNSIRLQRFEQEAQAAGALNHPNILAVYDVGSHENEPYVVSELLAGETLRERMGHGPVPQRKAVDYALQVARGLAAAHAKHIIHRDLKPENIFITEDGHVKILDFGLAKLIAPSDDERQSQVSTRKVLTDAGTVVGTVGYMSPEQVRGQTVDTRSDIFSFGAVLYEMLAGERAFHKDSTVETLNSILKDEPAELTSGNQTISPALERVVLHCLEKNADRRFQSASDVVFALENLSPSSASVPAQEQPVVRKSRERFVWIALIALLLVAIVFASVLGLRTRTNSAEIVRLPVAVPDNAYPVVDVEEHNMALSPDGKYLAFIANSAGKQMLYVRPLNSLVAQPLSGTDNAFSVFWSPDSRDMAFFAAGKLNRIEVSGKSLQTICNMPAPRAGATGSWGSQGTIVFSQDNDGSIYRVPATGGVPKLVVENSTKRPRRWIHFLSDGRRFLFCKHEENDNQPGIFAGSTDSNEIKMVASMSETRAQYVGGYLLYVREDSLMAQSFNENNLQFTGEPAVVVDRLPFFDKSGWVEFSASETGVLAYMSEYPKRRVAWFDRTGRENGQIGAPSDYGEVRLSPDSQKAVIAIGGDLWIYDLVRNTRTPFASGPTDDGEPVWSPDGQKIAYFSCCDDPSALHIKGSSDTGKGDLPIKDQYFIVPKDWSRDGRFIIYTKGEELWVLPLTSDSKPYLLIQRIVALNGASLSPDGRWVAFTSNETGQSEIYSARLDHPGEKFRISTEGGINPRWRRDGQELFYLSPNNHLMSVAIKPGDTFYASSPTPLFNTDPLTNDFDVTADGQRFVLITSAPGTQFLPYVVVFDWTAELKK
ncbi:MAG: hypothetical protein C5B55_10295 [Blastocatellia bacterium]|nr:MAG: hypothetical protein C5B55_10295 [Blastocatellia bacterium]